MKRNGKKIMHTTSAVEPPGRFQIAFLLGDTGNGEGVKTRQKNRNFA